MGRGVLRGERDVGEFVALWMKDARVLGDMNVNVWNVNEHVRSLIRSRQQINMAASRDRDVPRDSFVSGPAAGR